MPYCPANCSRLFHSDSQNSTQNSSFEISKLSSGNYISVASLDNLCQEDLNWFTSSEDISSQMVPGVSNGIKVSRDKCKSSEFHLETKNGCLDSASAPTENKRRKGDTVEKQKGKDSQSASASSVIESTTDGSTCKGNQPRKEVDVSGSVANEELSSAAGPSGLQSQHLGYRKGKRSVCKVCGKSFGFPYQLNQHYRMHSGEKPFVCHICNRQFSLKNNLKRHIPTHTEEKPFACPNCDKKLRDKHQLDDHVRTHNLEKHFECPICHKRFEYKKNLKRHIQTH